MKENDLKLFHSGCVLSFLSISVSSQSEKEMDAYVFYVCLFLFVLLSFAAPALYGSSQARGEIRAAAAGLHHSHSDTGSEPHLQPTYTTAHSNVGSLTH